MLLHIGGEFIHLFSLNIKPDRKGICRQLKQLNLLKNKRNVKLPRASDISFPANWIYGPLAQGWTSH